MRAQPESGVSQAQPTPSFARLGQGITWGLIGGLVGTVVMDSVLMGTLAVMGMPAVISFVTIGDTAAGFLAWFGIQIAGGFPLGVTLHYLLGLGLGAVFGLVVTQVEVVRVTTIKKGLVLGIVYIEIVSQPILVTSPLILKMTTAETVQWFGISAVMHLIWGVVLGGVVGYRLRARGVATGV